MKSKIKSVCRKNAVVETETLTPKTLQSLFLYSCLAVPTCDFIRLSDELLHRSASDELNAALVLFSDLPLLLESACLLVLY
ncbi:hypothetical protein L2E82_35894 [Cichorium intybus]|uniref:Uncharacterized protein n=1 Tax=Cichorium intybus TaxID=13427 RepID=A0ACB9BQ08_CICIN|nr:hypothetical protein L2E82_35894 [Cichorium intybus]